MFIINCFDTYAKVWPFASHSLRSKCFFSVKLYFYLETYRCKFCVMYSSRMIRL